VSGARDLMLFGQYHMLLCFAAIFITILSGNLLTGRFTAGFLNQPYAHTDFVWNFLGLFLTGFASALLGGCPFRQLILAGSGNTDSAITVMGLMTGAALSHNLGLASAAEGPAANGKAAFFICLACTICIAVMIIKNVKFTE